MLTWLNVHFWNSGPNLFVTADRPTLGKFTTREYYMWVAIFQQLKTSYRFEPSDKTAACLCAR